MRPEWLLYLLVLIGLKSIIVGQYWPWQYRHGCPFCKKRLREDK